MRRFGAAAVIAIAMLAVAAPAWGTPLIVVQTSISPRSFYFAETVTARVDVLVDRGRVDAGSVHIAPTFGAWQQVGLEQTRSDGSATISRRTWVFTIDCITSACLPKGTVAQKFHLPMLTVTARGRDGSDLRVSRAWPPLLVVGRFLPPTHPDIRPLMRADTTLPAARYRLSPSPFALLLDVLGGIAVAAAIGLGALELARSWAARHQSIDDRPPFVRALALVRQAKGRQPEDRRRAVGLLARTLPERSDGLSAAASEVAWSGAEPSPATLEELAQTVEAELEESR